MREHAGQEVSDYKFTDQELDNSTNLYNYDARLYDPVIGRFVNSDNIIPDWFDPQSLNRYSYCLNNPLIYIDPNGNAPSRNVTVLTPYASTQNSIKAFREYNNHIIPNIPSWKQLARVVSDGNTKLNVLIVAGHSVPRDGGVLLDKSTGEYAQFNYKGASHPDNADAVEEIKSQFTQNSILIIHGCQAGTYENDLKKMANLFQVKVWAFTGDLWAGFRPCTGKDCKRGKWVSVSPDQKRGGSGKNSNDYDSDENIEERIKRWEEILREIMRKMYEQKN